MKFPFFASFIVFCIWLGYELHKHRNLEEKANEDFWKKEAAANATRRKSLDSLNYISIPFERLPMSILCDDPKVAEYHSMLHELAKTPIVNLTGISNTDLKLQYGAPNIDLLSHYDQSYTLLARTLQAWAEVLYENSYMDEAQQVLEFAMETHTDLSSSYRLLASIYQQRKEPDKIGQLIPLAQELNSSFKDRIIDMLKEQYQAGENLPV